MTDSSLRIQFHLPQIQSLIIFIAVPDVDSHLNMIREIVLLRIRFAIDVTRKGISKQYADPKGKSEKCWLVMTAKMSS